MGNRGLSDDALEALNSCSKMVETDANVKIVAELPLPLIKAFVFLIQGTVKHWRKYMLISMECVFLVQLTGKVLP